MSNSTHLNIKPKLKYSSLTVPLFTPEQVYNIEKSWFNAGNQSYGLMQQAAWQISQWIYHSYSANDFVKDNLAQHALKVSVWVGSGNNGGDGWCVAYYLSQMGAQVSVVEVAKATTSDARTAKGTAIEHGIEVTDFDQVLDHQYSLNVDIIIDALFGIGLDHAPQDDTAKAIDYINTTRREAGSEGLKVISIDVPSGLVSRTGQVFESFAINADVTLCLVARKIGLHLKDAADYTGNIVDIPLIPSVLTQRPIAQLQYNALPIRRRENNTHKGSFGHALIVGGNQVDGSQGMGGAAILSSSTAFASGLGKLTVACHNTFHSSLISSVPNAMTVDLNDTKGVKELIGQCNVMAIGMGLGRDDKSLSLFETYLRTAIDEGVDMVIDADGLYHLSTLSEKSHTLIDQLKKHSNEHQVWYTPHSGEAARLLNTDTDYIESDRLTSIKRLANKYHGSWLLKGAGSIVIEQSQENEHGHSQLQLQSQSQSQSQLQAYVCAAGNPGMATAGMGDVLSGLAAGLLAQTALEPKCRSLQQAVLIHAMAGDRLEKEVGVWALQASDMPSAVGKVMKQLTVFS